MPWNYAGAFTHVLKPYIIEHALDIFEKSQYAQVLANERGFTDPHARIKQELKYGANFSDPLLTNNTLWAVETVMIKAFLDLASFSPVPASHYPPGQEPPILATAAVFYSNNAYAPPGTPIWRKHPTTQGTKDYVPNHKIKINWVTSVLGHMRRSQVWSNTIKESIHPKDSPHEGKTINDPGAPGWWGEVLSSKNNTTRNRALAEAGADASDDAAADEVLTSDADVKAERKFQEQCFLIDHYEKICGYNAGNPYGNYFTCIGAGPTINPSAVISKIVAPTEVSPLMSAPQEIFARIQPKIRLFKRFRQKQRQVKQYSPISTEDGRSDYVVSWYQPQDKIVQKEILFADNDTSESIKDAFAPKAGGTKEGVALKRFEWTYYGANPIEADVNIRCKLTLFFRNLEDLGASDGTGGGRTATFLDLILFGPEKGKSPEPNPYGVKFNEWNPDYYEIKASIGYHKPPGNELVDKDGNSLVNLLKNSSVTLGLVLLNHTFSFNEDGSGTLDIDLQGIVESHLSSNRADLFYTSKRLATQLKKIDKELAFINRQLEGTTDTESTVEFTKEDPAGDYNMAEKASLAAFDFLVGLDFLGDAPNYKDLGPIRVENNRGTYEDRKKILEERRARFARNEKTERYGALINRLLAMDKMRYIDVNHNMMGILTEGREQLSKMTSSKIQGAGTTRKDPGIQILKADSADLKARHKEYLDSASGALDEATTDEKTRKKKRKEAKEKFVTPAKDKDKYRINFFYLGDLLEAAFYQALDDPKIKKGKDKKDTEDYTFSNIRFLLGPITFVDPRDHSPVQINLADLPVSLNLFMNWYLNNVIAAQKDTYYIRNFIRDVVKDLILETLSPGCFYKYPVRPRFNITSLSAPGKGKASNAKDRVGMVVTGKKGRPTQYTQGGRIQDINEIAPYPLSNIGSNPPREFFYEFIYCQDGIPWNLIGNRSQDSSKGIYHFQIGSDRGILKNATFDRQDQPHVREARTVSDGSDPIAAQLRHQYNVTLKCFGSTIFKPGMRVHVTPRLAKQGSVAATLEKSLTYKLGLGGYVFLTKVENIIEPGRFETILHGINDGMVKRIGGSKGDLTRQPRIIGPTPPEVEEAPAEKKSTAKQNRTTPTGKMLTPCEIEAEQLGEPPDTHCRQSKVPEDQW